MLETPAGEKGRMDDILTDEERPKYDSNRGTGLHGDWNYPSVKPRYLVANNDICRGALRYPFEVVSVEYTRFIPEAMI